MTWSAPGRVNLIGEHTDYNDGFALPFALPQRTRVQVAAASDPAQFQVTSTFAHDGDTTVAFPVTTSPAEPVTGWAAYVAGVVWAFTDAGHDVAPMNLDVTSDVPVGAGLSSSAALECAVAVAIDDLGGLGLDRTTLATLARRAENDYVGAPTGIMDQVASLFGRDGHVVLIDCQTHDVDLVPCEPAAAGLTLLVIDTQAPHRHVDGEYGARRRSCEQAAAALGVRTLREVQDASLDEVLGRLDDDVVRRRARHILTENARVLETVAALRDDRLSDIGPLLTGSHASMRDDFEITVPEVDVAVDVAIRAGAVGARMTGGGFGGSIIALAPTEATSAIVDAVTSAFDDNGFAPPRTFETRPSAGAGRDEKITS